MLNISIFNNLKINSNLIYLSLSLNRSVIFIEDYLLLSPSINETKGIPNRLSSWISSWL